MSDEIQEDEIEEAPELQAARYIVRTTFRQSVNGVLLSFPAGTVLEDQTLITMLRDHNGPIDPILDDEDLFLCQHCGRASSISGQRSAKDLLRRARQIMPGIR